MEMNSHIFGQVAPTLAQALEGPCATMAQRFLLEGLQQAEVPVDIKQPLNQQAWLSDTQALQTVRQLEQGFQQELQSLGLGAEALKTPVVPSATATVPERRFQQVENFRPQMFISALFFVAYFLILGAIIYIEASDSVNMQQGANSFMDQIQILIGVLTAGVGQVLSYWFGGMMGTKDKAGTD